MVKYVYRKDKKQKHLLFGDVQDDLQIAPASLQPMNSYVLAVVG